MIEEVLVSNSSLVSGLSEASGVELSWVEVSQGSLKKVVKRERGGVPRGSSQSVKVHYQQFLVSIHFFYTETARIDFLPLDEV